jgi:hypothetical protein
MAVVLQKQPHGAVRGGAVQRRKQHEVELPDLEIFRIQPGVVYFDPREWDNFPFSAEQNSKKRKTQPH